MAHAQNSPRGLFQKNNVLIPAGGAIKFELTNNKITANSTGIMIGSRYISTNTTGNTST